MIPIDRFQAALQTAMGGRLLDQQQFAVVSQTPGNPLIVVAGPGTGKTTAIVARALKLAFVDGWDPNSMMLTTFTKKAAAEMRSRILGWGIGVSEALGSGNSDLERSFLESLDINRFRTGTLDSLAEQVLSEYRPANTSPPVVLDEFIANGVLLRSGLFENNLWQNADLLTFSSWHSGNPTPSVRDLLRLCRSYADRAVHDLLDLPQFAAVNGPHQAMATVIEQYQAGLSNLGPSVVDFALLEYLFLDQLRSGALDGFCSELQAIFVDEYQDTNALQEAIYMEIARKTAHSITIVGDDDQSLYRFRGGTVELFSGVQHRVQSGLSGSVPTVLYLSSNYRSSRELVTFVSDFVDLDPQYQPSRIPNKPRLQGPQFDLGLPVLGLFRPNIDDLAYDLAEMMDYLFNQRAVSLTTDVGNINLTVPNEGMPGDCAFLGFSVREQTSWNPYGSGGQPRLPLLLRQNLSLLGQPISVFNPRGQPLHQVIEVRRLCGLMLECIDPGAVVQNSVLNLGPQVDETLNQWRGAARRFISSNPSPTIPSSLIDFVASWGSKTPQIGNNWPDSIPLLDLCYQISTWLPSLHEEPEKQIFLEVIARAITKSATLNRFGSRVVNEPNHLERPSVLEAIRNIFAPLAMGDISIDEELLEEFPRDAVNVLTIHQAKGLEFPMVIVDVAAHYRTNHPSHRNMRFPDRQEEVHIVEDYTIPHSELRSGQFRLWRDRAFDDLVRRYFVAFSRPQTLLVLVGLNAARPERTIRNVALGFERSGTSHWVGNGRPYQEIQDIGPFIP